MKITDKPGANSIQITLVDRKTNKSETKTVYGIHMEKLWRIISNIERDDSEEP